MTCPICESPVATDGPRAMCLANGHLFHLGRRGRSSSLRPCPTAGGVSALASPFLSEIPAQGGGGPFGDGGQQRGALRHCAALAIADLGKPSVARCAGTTSAESVERRLFGAHGVEGPSTPAPIVGCETGGLSGAVKAAKPTATAEKSSLELCRRSPFHQSSPAEDAAPGRLVHPHTGPDRARHPNFGDVIGAAALFVFIIAATFIAGAL